MLLAYIALGAIGLGLLVGECLHALSDYLREEET